MADKQFTIRIPVGFMVVYRIYPEPPLYHAFYVCREKRFWMAVSLILLTAVGTYLITRYQMEVPLHHMKRTRLLQHIPKIKLQQQAVWFLYVVVIAFSAAVGLLTQLYHQIMERQAVEFEKKKAELALYKAQINPHFLFNNLNTLYAMVVTGSPKTEDAFIQFINLMKYMYANNTKDKIPLHIEVEYIRQYIELQKYRIAENFDVHFSYVHDETEQMNIVPMILITFVENVFKHGVSSHKKRRGVYYHSRRKRRIIIGNKQSFIKPSGLKSIQRNRNRKLQKAPRSSLSEQV